jgi:hypothetical protein
MEKSVEIILNQSLEKRLKEVYTKVLGVYKRKEWNVNQRVRNLEKSKIFIREQITNEVISLEKLKRKKNPNGNVAREYVQEAEECLRPFKLADSYKRFKQERKKKNWNNYFRLKKKCKILKFNEKATGKRMKSELKK